jgi:hypothetical protein
MKRGCSVLTYTYTHTTTACSGRVLTTFHIYIPRKKILFGMPRLQASVCVGGTCQCSKLRGCVFSAFQREDIFNDRVTVKIIGLLLNTCYELNALICSL